MGVIVTYPWSDYQKGALSAALIAEVSGVLSSIEAAAACGIDRGSNHPDDGDFTCVDWNTSKITIPDFWRVYFTFESKQGGQLETPLRVQFNPGLRSEPIDRDTDGNPIINSAGDPNDPPIQTDFTTLAFRVIRTESAPFDAARALSFMRCVNSTACTIAGMKFDEGQLLCKVIAPIAEVTSKSRRIDIGYDFEGHGEGWDARVLDQGYRGISSNTGGTRGGRGGGPTEIYNPPNPDDTNTIKPVQISVPVRLNGKGKPILDVFTDRYGDKLIEADQNPKGAVLEKTADAVFLHWKTRPRADLNQLGLK